MSDEFQELERYHRREVRRGIVRAISRYCYETGTPHQEVWREVYDRLVNRTGVDLIGPARSKLDLVEEAGHLNALHRIVMGYV